MPVAEHRACSFRYPVCALGSASTFLERAPSLLVELERAYERMVLAMRMPAPIDLTYAEKLELYLSTEVTDLTVAQRARAFASFDEALTFCEASPRLSDRDAASRCVSGAIASTIDAGERPGVRAGFAAYLESVANGLGDALVEAIDAVQRRPDRGLFDDEHAARARGSLILFDYLEARYASPPGLMAASLLSASASQTGSHPLDYNNEPDLFDVIRHTLGPDPNQVASFVGDFALERALGRLPLGSRVAGSFGRVRFDWVIKASSLPRRVASVRPLQPNGSVYVWLDLDDFGPKDALGFEANWEEPSPFKWTITKVNRKGEPSVTVDIPLQEKARFAQQTVVDLADQKGLLIVGTHTGDLSASYPFDPDWGPFEPHGCTVYLARLKE